MTANLKKAEVPLGRILFFLPLGFAILMAFIFLPAGSFDWTRGWIYLAFLFVSWAIFFLIIIKKNPTLIKHRMSIGEGTKNWDRFLIGLMRLIFFAVYIVAGFDAVRYEWTVTPFWLMPIGALIHSLGYAGITWAMITNKHFEGTVRIQKDRDHQVVDTGPYRWVRHPGYVGFSLMVLSTPLLLGSLWAFLPAILVVMTLVIRTFLEDTMLRSELTGYADYAQRVRYRLVPGVF